MSDNDLPNTNLTYQEAVHAIQTGVLNDPDSECNMRDFQRATKHLRVGINSALINDAALVRLLVKKGIITWEEYGEEVRLEACREVDRYEARLQVKVR